MKYPALKGKRLEGTEPIVNEKGEAVSSMQAFWSWAYSNTVDNAQRGVFAEYLVATVLGVNEGIRVNWEKYDMVSPDGISVEVKSSGYIQNWGQNELSQLSFDIRPTRAYDIATNTYSGASSRQADIYVFCVHNHTDQETINPLDISQWDFYLLPTSLLNEKLGPQKGASLATILKIGAEKCEHGCRAGRSNATRGRRPTRTERSSRHRAKNPILSRTTTSLSASSTKRTTPARSPRSARQRIS